MPAARSARGDGPEVVAHRGATSEAPEHTLAAYRHAAEIGADAVECDVRMTRDGVLVCVHDRRVGSTSNGRGVVSALHLRELEQFHFGARRRGRRSAWADDEITAVTDDLHAPRAWRRRHPAGAPAPCSPRVPARATTSS